VSEDVTRLVLVRHGEAVCNVAGVIGGPKGCTGLTPLGRAQAAKLADRLARTRELGEVAALYASVLPRAVETAQILARALLGPGGEVLEVTRDCALCELHPGDADGLTWGEFVASFEEPDWDADPSRPVAPGGEGWSGFVERAAAALERVAAAHAGRTVVVVTHAGVVEAGMLRFLPLDPGVARLGLHTAHASLTEWRQSGGRVDGDGTRGRWRLERYNDAATV
jgi:2,3-bisphosphoglycerate-dependent phosphoglycerate mutase